MPDWTGAVAGVVLALLGWVASYGALRARVVDLKEDVNEIKAKLDKATERQERVLAEVAQLHADVAVLGALVNTMEQHR